MQQISNKTLSFLLIVAIVVSVAGTMVSVYRLSVFKAQQRPGDVAGFASSAAGTASVTLVGFGSIVINSNVDFGSGTQSTNISNLTSLTTETADNYATFNNCSEDIWDQAADCRGIEIENDGAVTINVSMQASSNASTFFSGNSSQALFQYFTADGNRSKEKNSSCFPRSGSNINVSPWGYPNLRNWTNITTDSVPICANLSFTNSNDTITVELNITIPADETTGTKTNTFTFSAVQIS